MSREKQWRSELAQAVREVGNHEQFTVTVEPTEPSPFLVLSENTFHAVSVRHDYDTDQVRIKLDLDDPVYITTEKELEFSVLGVQFEGEVITTGGEDGHTIIVVDPSDCQPPDGGWDE